MSQQAVSADIIPNSAVWAPPEKAARVQHMIQLYAATSVQTGFYLPLYAVLFSMNRRGPLCTLQIAVDF